MVGQKLRKYGFWTIDLLKGGKVRQHYRYLRGVLKETDGNNEDALRRLLTHAIDTVPAYSIIKNASLSQFPVVSKQNYKGDFEAYRSTKYLCEDNLHKVFTSGSTGTPFMAYQDQEKIKWHQAGLIGLNESIGWDLGARFMFMRVWGVAHNESKLSQLLSNTVPVNVVDFSDAKIESTRQRILKDKSLHIILGYASAVEKLADHILACGDNSQDLGIKIVIADSESLLPSARKKIEMAFSCPVLDRYANNENGILAITKVNDSRFYVNYPEYYVEILKLDSDEPVNEGEIGRIVITDLYNYAFPFIRYDTGDLGVASKVINGQCFIISELKGRISATLTDVKGQLLAETVVTAFFEDLPQIGRYQVIQQSGHEYQILLERNSQVAADLVLERAHRCFGNEAKIQIEYVEKIAQLNNGKYPITVNKMK